MQEADVLLARLPDQFRAIDDRLRLTAVKADAAAEERTLVAGRELEKVGAVEEELTLLRKEQRKAREVGAALIDFGLREIGVDGEVRFQRGRDEIKT